MDTENLALMELDAAALLEEHLAISENKEPEAAINSGESEASSSSASNSDSSSDEGMSSDDKS